MNPASKAPATRQPTAIPAIAPVPSPESAVAGSEAVVGVGPVVLFDVDVGTDTRAVLDVVAASVEGSGVGSGVGMAGVAGATN